MMTEERIAELAVRAGMRAAEVVEFLDNVRRWRALGLVKGTVTVDEEREFAGFLNGRSNGPLKVPA
jgi:hypothetical protein